MTGRGSAWLERSVWDAEVTGSNPVAPTIFKDKDEQVLSEQAGVRMYHPAFEKGGII